MGKFILINCIILNSLFTISVVLMMTKRTASECPEVPVSETDKGQPYARVMFDEPINQTCTPVPGSQFQIGNNPVMCRGADGESCSFTVTVRDTEPPVFTDCPQKIQKYIGNGFSQSDMPTTVVTWDSPEVSDNSEQPPLMMSTHESGDEFPVGSTEVVYTATDPSDNQGNCTFPVQVKAYYTPPKDRIFIKNFQNPSNENCLSITWPKQDNATTDYSIYIYKEGEGKPTPRERTVAHRGSSTYMYKDLCGLQAGQLYTVEVESVLENGQVRTASARHYTKPLPPTDLKVLPGKKSPSSLVLSWSRSQQNVDQYEVVTGNRLQYVSKTTDRVEVDNLKPDQTYKMTVRSVVGSGIRRSHSNSLSKQITTADFRDSELIAYSYTETTIKVAWNDVIGTSDELNPYMLIIEPQDAVENYLNVFNSTSQFTGLKPNTNYHIQLMSNLGFHLETTQKTRPGRVSNLRAVYVLEDSFTLRWDLPTEGDVDSYDVSISPGNWTEPTNLIETSFEFSSLDNETEYFITVVSIYEDTRSIPETILVTTGVTTATNSLENVALVVGCVLAVLVVIQLIVIVILCRRIKKKSTDAHVYDDTKNVKREIDSDEFYEDTTIGPAY